MGEVGPWTLHEGAKQFGSATQMLNYTTIISTCVQRLTESIISAFSRKVLPAAAILFRKLGRHWNAHSQGWIRK
ncbi:hypothetical protein GCM10010377_12180 [Streptomyces viridiviolaceus]|nr:hypothetical protein GCM10010377_12180 [Streptomyces viridiviolaceus]